jgi:hypothetical protein
MIIQLSLSAPEHSHLLVNYHEVFIEQTFSMNWNYTVIPQPGDFLDFQMITDLVADQVNITMLPKIWQVMDIKWSKQTDGIVPILNVVGK